MDRDLRRQTIQRALAQRVAGVATAGAIAEAVVGTWDQAAARLVPVIGARGVDALFGRALHLTRKAFPWLAEAATDGCGAVSPASFGACMAGREPAEAAEAGQALLATFSDLLETLIGESLSERLLAPFWTVEPTPSAPEIEP